MEDEIISQLGLLLTQLRMTRRALEDIERSTARYGGVTFALAAAAGPRFGEPPLLNGALKVFIVNINDLSPARSLGGFIEGILGGIGRFFGGLVGGVVGGTIGGVALVVIFDRFEKIVQGIKEITKHIDDIIGRLKIKPKEGETPASKTAESGSSIGETVSPLIPIIDALTALFTAASSGPDAAGKVASEAATSKGKEWAEILKTVNTTLERVTQLVDGLTLSMPILIGSYALLIARLNDLKLAVVEMLQFVLQMALVLRGVILVTLYDTIGAAARLAASILTILKDTVGKILESVFAMIGALLSTVEEFVKFFGGGLKKVMDSLLDWLVSGLGRVLAYLGELKIFRLVVHIVQVLPNLLPALIMLVHGKSISEDDRKMLQEAAKKTIPGPPAPAAVAKALKDNEFPDIGKKFLEDVKPFKDSLDATSKTLTTKAEDAFKAGETGLKSIDAKMKEALTKGEPDFSKKLEGDLKKVGETSIALAGVLTPAVDAARKAKEAGDEDGLGRIAKAYEGWLSGGGLDQLLGLVTERFKKTSRTEPGTMPAAVVGTATPEPVRATVEIKELIIDLKPAPSVKKPAAKGAKPIGLNMDDVPWYDEYAQRAAAA